MKKSIKNEYLNELNLDKESIRKFVKKNKKGKKNTEVEKGYTLYETSKFGRFCNTLMGEIGNNLIEKHPNLFKKLLNNVKISGIKMLSKT